MKQMKLMEDEIDEDGVWKKLGWWRMKQMKKEDEKMKKKMEDEDDGV